MQTVLHIFEYGKDCYSYSFAFEECSFVHIYTINCFAGNMVATPHLHTTYLLSYTSALLIRMRSVHALTCYHTE